MISVVVPALDEAAGIADTLATARDPAVLEVVLVDGGSRDDTIARARDLVDQVVLSPPGRARQMNAGAARARGDVLLFLHADTHLPAGFGDAVCGAVAAGAVGGRFDVRLRGSHPLLRLVERLMNLRSRATRIFTGDQAIFVRRDVFSAMGGFADIPLMEDVELSSRLRRLGPIASLRLRVATSGRRWEEEGALRTILLMWSLRLAYACGVPPERLAAAYRRRRVTATGSGPARPGASGSAG